MVLDIGSGINIGYHINTIKIINTIKGTVLSPLLCLKLDI